MERITMQIGDGPEYAVAIGGGQKPTADDIAKAVLSRLGAYEDTGLTPEEIHALVQREERAMTIEELLDFCAKREVEIYTRYDFFCDSIIIQMRKKNLKTEAAISRDMAASARFNLTVRRVLREMADKLDKEAQV